MGKFTNTNADLQSAKAILSILDRIEAAAAEIQQSIRELGELTTVAHTNESNLPIPIIATIPYRSVAPIVSQIFEHLDSIDGFHHLLAGCIINSAEANQLHTRHPDTALQECLNIPKSRAKNLLKSWRATTEPPQKPALNPHLIHAALRAHPEELTVDLPLHDCSLSSAQEQPEQDAKDNPGAVHTLSPAQGQSEPSPHRPTDPSLLSTSPTSRTAYGENSSPLTWNDVPRITELTESQQQMVVQARVQEHRRRIRQFTHNQKILNNAINSRALGNSARLIILNEVQKLSPTSNISEQDVIAETLNWIRFQHDDYLRHCARTGAAPISLIRIVSDEDIASLIRARIKELNAQASPLKRLDSFADRQLTVGKPTKDNMVSLNAKLPAETAANLISILSALGNNPNNPHKGQDPRNLSQRNADNFHNILNAAAENYRTRNKLKSDNPRAVVTVATDAHELAIIHQAAAIIDYAQQHNLLPDIQDRLSAAQSFSRANLSPQSNPPGSIHPQHAHIIETANQLFNQVISPTAGNESTSPRLANAENTLEEAIHTAIMLLLTHAFETDTGIPLTLLELSRLGISDTYFTCEVDPQRAQISKLSTHHRNGGPLFRAMKTVEQAVCAMPGEKTGIAQCELHHITPWSRGGKTSMENLTAISRRRHVTNDDTQTKAHKGHFTRNSEGIVGWVRPKNDDPTSYVHTNQHPQAMRAPARLIQARRKTA